jgi:peroxiredoxin
MRNLIIACLLLGAVPPSVSASSGQERAEAAGSSLIGTAAPALKLTTIDGREIDLAQLYGHQAVYLKFWATWCVPCRQQMPHFEHTYEHAGRNLAVIAINAGFNDTLADVKAYRKSLGLKMPIVIDDGRLADALHLRVTPQHIVIARDGRILYIGHLADDRLETALAAAQAEPAGKIASPPVATALPAALTIGSPVPDLTLHTADGAPLPLRDPQGVRATVILFLSPWCESYLAKSRPQRAAQCRLAREQSQSLASNTQARWVGIASGLWASNEDLIAYRDEKHIGMPLTLDETGSLFRTFGVTDVPVLLLVEPGGRVSRRIDQITDHLADQLGCTSGRAGLCAPGTTSVLSSPTISSGSSDAWGSASARVGNPGR